LAQVDDALKPLLPFFKRRDVKEISINEPGTVWLEIAGKGYVAESAKALTFEWCYALCKTLGFESGTGFSNERPIVSCQLPGGHRFQGLVSKQNVMSGVAISIRLRREMALTLEDFGVSDRHTPLNDSNYGDGIRWKSPNQRGSTAWLEDIVRQGAPILISGGTSTGKTTFLNTQILPMIPKQFRVITIQDVPEIRVPHVNKVEMIVPRTKQANGSQLTYQHIIDNVNRLNPTQLILGELSVDNAFGAIRLLNMGESSFIVTLHANNPTEALEAFRRNIDLSGHSSLGAVGLLVRTIGAIVQLEFDERAKRPRVKEIVCPADLDWHDIVDETGISSNLTLARKAVEAIAGHLGGLATERTNP
tara:strand:+ start:24061 stop:25146 length:1086 start_codon:yes stop_codon:yes gene_type:complete